MIDFNSSKFDSLLKTRWLGREYLYFEQIDSTNRLLMETGDVHGCVGVTDFQLQGRGRMGRRWVAPARSSLLVSMLFRPKLPPTQLHWLTMITGIAIVETLAERCNLPCGLKWPNDVVIGEPQGEWHKIAGILAETQFVNEEVERVVVGFGLNVNISADQLPTGALPASSLLVATGNRVQREELLASILGKIEGLYLSAEKDISPQPLWNQHLWSLGRTVSVTIPNGIVSGRVTGCDGWGRLLVTDKDGTEHVITAGDVTLRRPD